MSSPLPRVNLAGFRKLIEASIASNTPMEAIGAPGIGKTAITREATDPYVRRISGVFRSLVLSQCDQSDVGGIPVPASGVAGGPIDRVLRMPVGPIKDLSTRGGVLFLDEFGNAHSAIKGSALTLLQERYAGDTQLHPDARIILASNPMDQSEGGHDYGAPTIGRLSRFLVVPDLSEVQSFFATLGTPGSTLEAWARDLAATWGVEPRLLQVDPPAGSVRAGRGWGSPRAWHRALMLACALIDAGEDPQGELVFAALSGNVSEETGGSFLAIQKVRKDLPSDLEIATDPAGAKLPATPEQEIACVGLLQHVGLKSPESAWIYADRLSEEIQVVAYRGLMRFVLNRGASKSKLINAAIAAQSRIIGRSSKGGALNVTGW